MIGKDTRQLPVEVDGFKEVPADMQAIMNKTADRLFQRMPASSGETMRWVKGSKGIPKVEKLDAVWIEWNGKKQAAEWKHGAFYTTWGAIPYSDDQWGPTPEERKEQLSKLRWLDESASPSNAREDAFQTMHNKEVFFRLENNDDGFYLSIIDRSKYPRVWADNFQDNDTIISETTDNLINRTVDSEKDWKERYFGETIQECIDLYTQSLKK